MTLEVEIVGAISIVALQLVNLGILIQMVRDHGRRIGKLEEWKERKQEAAELGVANLTRSHSVV